MYRSFFFFVFYPNKSFFFVDNVSIENDELLSQDNTNVRVRGVYCGYGKKMISGIKCFKNQPCYVIKMREMIRYVGNKTSKKEMDNSSFL